MHPRTSRRRLSVLALAAGLLTIAPTAMAATPKDSLSPADARLVPNPIESSDPGSTWTCQTTGPTASCSGHLAYGWDLEPGPDDWCAAPLSSVNGRFERRQTRYYSLDPATGRYLETNRLVHLEVTDSLTAAPQDPAAPQVDTVLRMMWASDFTTPGDPDSRVTRKQGIDTWFKPPHGGVFTLDVGQKTTIGSDDFDLHGRWDVATAADPFTEFGKVCTALELT